MTETPKRIQRRRTKGWRMPPNTVYVGRPSKWGNPFKVGVVSAWQHPGCAVGQPREKRIGKTQDYRALP